MARPRIRQFAGDMGISYDQAKGLINEGRRRKDGGAEVLESSMNKMRGFEAGGTLSSAAEKLNKLEAEIEEMAKIATEDTDIDVNVNKDRFRAQRKFNQPDPSRQRPESKAEQRSKRGRNKPYPRKNRRADRADGGTVSAESGKYMSCRGMGAAIQGNKFTGVY